MVKLALYIYLGFLIQFTANFVLLLRMLVPTSCQNRQKNSLRLRQYKIAETRNHQFSLSMYKKADRNRFVLF
jgi:hypothetical protein